MNTEIRPDQGHIWVCDFKTCKYRSEGATTVSLFVPLAILFECQRARPIWKSIVEEALTGTVSICLNIARSIIRGPVSSAGLRGERKVLDFLAECLEILAAK